MSEKYNILEPNSLESEKKIDEEETNLDISPEMEEMVMEKVEDINKVGTAYTKIVGMGASSLNMNLDTKVSSVFRFGVISPLWLIDILNKEKTDKGYKTVFPDRINRHHKGKRGFVFFNIVGKTAKNERDQDFGENENEIDEVLDSDSDVVISIIFDLNKYNSKKEKEYANYLDWKQEKDEKLKEEKYRKVFGLFAEHLHSGPRIDQAIEAERRNLLGEAFEAKTRTYGYSPMRQPFNESAILDGDGLPKPLAAYGHVLSSRIPPRYFKGVVIKIKLKKEDLEKEIVEKLIVCMADSKSGLLPIYDSKGNLIWPQKMSHEEIVKMKEGSVEK